MLVFYCSVPVVESWTSCNNTIKIIDTRRVMVFICQYRLIKAGRSLSRLLHEYEPKHVSRETQLSGNVIWRKLIRKNTLEISHSSSQKGFLRLTARNTAVCIVIAGRYRSPIIDTMCGVILTLTVNTALPWLEEFIRDFLRAIPARS